MIEDRFIDIKEARRVTGKSTATIYRWVRTGAFPKPRRLGDGASVSWLESEVKEWMHRQPEADPEDRPAPKRGKVAVARGLSDPPHRRGLAGWRGV